MDTECYITLYTTHKTIRPLMGAWRIAVTHPFSTAWTIALSPNSICKGGGRSMCDSALWLPSHLISVCCDPMKIHINFRQQTWKPLASAINSSSIPLEYFDLANWGTCGDLPSTRDLHHKHDRYRRPVEYATHSNLRGIVEPVPMRLVCGRTYAGKLVENMQHPSYVSLTAIHQNHTQVWRIGRIESKIDIFAENHVLSYCTKCAQHSQPYCKNSFSSFLRLRESYRNVSSKTTRLRTFQKNALKTSLKILSLRQIIPPSLASFDNILTYHCSGNASIHERPSARISHRFHVYRLKNHKCK